MRIWSVIYIHSQANCFSEPEYQAHKFLFYVLGFFSLVILALRFAQRPSPVTQLAWVYGASPEWLRDVLQSNLPENSKYPAENVFCSQHYRSNN